MQNSLSATWSLPPQDGHLMSQGDEFKLQGDAAANTEREQGNEGGKNCDHAHDGMAVARKSLAFLDFQGFEQPQRHIGQLSTNKLVRLSGREDLAEMVVAAGSPEPAPMEPFRCAPKTSPFARSPDRPSLHRRERSSPVKNWKRENCTSGTVRDEDGNILIYSAKGQGLGKLPAGNLYAKSPAVAVISISR